MGLFSLYQGEIRAERFRISSAGKILGFAYLKKNSRERFRISSAGKILGFAYLKNNMFSCISRSQCWLEKKSLFDSPSSVINPPSSLVILKGCLDSPLRPSSAEKLWECNAIPKTHKATAGARIVRPIRIIPHPPIWYKKYPPQKILPRSIRARTSASQIIPSHTPNVPFTPWKKLMGMSILLDILRQILYGASL